MAYNRQPLGISWFDVAFCDNTSIGHITTGWFASSGSVWHLYYQRDNLNDSTGLWDVDCNHVSGIELVAPTNNHIAPAICLLENKPVVAACLVDSYAPSLSVFFSDDEDPNALGNFTEHEYDWATQFGSYTYFIPHIHAINSTHVFIICERITDQSIYACYASESGGISTPFELIGDTCNAFLLNSWFYPTLNTVSEHTLNSSDYAEGIGISYVNSTGFVKFGIFDVNTATMGSLEIIADNSTATGSHIPNYTTVAKDQDSYFVGWSGYNLTNYDEYFFYISERAANGASWNTTKIKTFNDAAYNTDSDTYGCAMSKTPIDGYFYCTYTDTLDDYYVFKVSAQGEEYTPPIPSDSDSFWLWFTDRTSLWFGLLGGIMLILAPLFLVKSFKDGDITGLGIALLIMTVVGFGLVVGWLYG
jgi:hypothetical protein